MKFSLLALILIFYYRNTFAINNKDTPILNCSKFYSGKFIDYDDLGGKQYIIKREGEYSDVYEMDSKTVLVKSKLQIIGNCLLKFIKYEYNHPVPNEEYKKIIMAFQSIEEIYKIEDNIAYYRGVNCKCKGRYKKIE